MPELKWFYNNQMTISQVVIFFERHEIFLTKTMIQHYIRICLLPPPLKKHYYTHEHLKMLFIIDYLKIIYSLAEIKALFMMIMRNFDNFSNCDPSMNQVYEQFQEITGKLSSYPLYINLEVSDNPFFDIFTLMCQSAFLKRYTASYLK